ncbi:hypothetical protein [Pseudactinotalea terrae]|uniref:hypothetical protein n=1 Tax=Pseudactinotalea terrae TaxID=1743262 RepID=UPI0012E10E91|nr:hypothetical protein [Pseudactinotalea terrae]
MTPQVLSGDPQLTEISAVDIPRNNSCVTSRSRSVSWYNPSINGARSDRRAGSSTNAVRLPGVRTPRAITHSPVDVRARPSGGSDLLEQGQRVLSARAQPHHLVHEVALRTAAQELA